VGHNPRVPATPSTARRARAAVAALFLANGALYANVVPRYPDLRAQLDLSNAAFGSAIGAYGLGALVLGLVASVIVSRWGSRRVAPLSTLGLAANLVLVAVAPSWGALAAALWVAGGLDALADLAGNVHGLRVERRYGRSVLNSLHGAWSIGAVVGGGMGAAAAGLALPLVWHLALAGGLCAVVATVASRYLLPGPDDTERRAPPRAPARRTLPRLGRGRVAARLAALGLVAAMAQSMEDAGATWGVVYLHDELAAAAAVSGLGFVALQTCQIVSRLVGDRVVTRYGDVAVARTGAALAGGAMAAALLVPSTPATVLAFGAVGLGIGTLIPASLRSADALPGLPRGFGMVVVGTVDRLALFVLPPLVGVVADLVSLRVGLTVIPVAAVVALLLAPALRGSVPPGRLRAERRRP
jgi:MFS family permease